MSVKRKTTSSISNFIEKGAAVKESNEKEFKNILIRVPRTLLSEIDALIEKKPWFTRTQWILDSIHEKLKKEE